MLQGEGHKLLAAHWTDDANVGSVVLYISDFSEKHRVNNSKHRKNVFDDVAFGKRLSIMRTLYVTQVFDVRLLLCCFGAIKYCMRLTGNKELLFVYTKFCV